MFNKLQVSVLMFGQAVEAPADVGRHTLTTGQWTTRPTELELLCKSILKQLL